MRFLDFLKVKEAVSVLKQLPSFFSRFNKVRPPQGPFENADTSQFPVIQVGAVNTTLDFINFQINNPNMSLIIDPSINPNDVPQELHFDTIEELQAFYDSLNSTNIESETIIDINNPDKVITRCTFPDWTFDFNVYIEQTLGDNYNVDDITSNITGITMLVAYEQLNWTTTTVLPLANLSNVDVNSEAEVTLFYKGVGTLFSFAINFNIWLNIDDGTERDGSMTID